MWQMYTDDARRVRSVAPRHAKRLHRDAVGIEHLLLALIEYGRGPVEEAFFAIGITPGEVAAQLESRGENAWDPTAGAEPIELPYTPGASHALGLILDEKRRLGHDYIGSEHILLAVLRQLDNAWAEPEPASELLERLGVGLGRLRKELLSRIPAEYDRPLSTQTDTIRRLGVSPFMDWLGPEVTGQQ